MISGDFLELGCMNPTLSDWEERKHPRGHLAIQRSKAEPFTWPKFEGFVATVVLKGSTIGTSINFIWIFLKFGLAHTLGARGHLVLMFYLQLLGSD